MKIIFVVLVGLAIIVNLVAFFGEIAMKKKISKIAEQKERK